MHNISHVMPTKFKFLCIKTYMYNFDFFSAHTTILMREIKLYTYYVMEASGTLTKCGNTCQTFSKNIWNFYFRQQVTFYHKRRCPLKITSITFFQKVSLLMNMYHLLCSHVSHACRHHHGHYVLDNLSGPQYSAV